MFPYIVTVKFLLIFVFCSYNKTESDFASLREYNDYLEEVETISESKRYCYISILTPISWVYTILLSALHMCIVKHRLLPDNHKSQVHFV